MFKPLNDSVLVIGRTAISMNDGSQYFGEWLIILLN